MLVLLKMTLDNAKELLRAGRVLRLIKKLDKKISIPLRICCFSCMFRGREGALIFTGEFQFQFLFVELFLLKEFIDLFVLFCLFLF